MDKTEIYEIWDRFEQSAATEVLIELNGARLSFKKEAAGKKADPAIRSEAGDRTAPDPSKRPDARRDSALEENGEAVKAPLLGTFYRAPSPEADPFVKVGDKVQKGDVVAMIEAMKLMNELVAPRDGVVKEICVEDGELAEYGQILMWLE
ncbi:MAG: acetyl-CoA carboxylase biotin carboxyl carrier protein [Lachnospiraceae bacterium]|jgi:acetyl-CoA carboxylase biotin carboxyl carrier protein|nr:acetyl-CoA carboxylase biotin carboxyl carrier protein [Lachnospiraceae bacterium]